MYITDKECTFVFDEVLKHSRPKYYQKPLNYLDIRLTSSSDPPTIKPFKPVSRDKIARWIKNAMKEANTDIGLLTAHTCRSASISKQY